MNNKYILPMLVFAMGITLFLYLFTNNLIFLFFLVPINLIIALKYNYTDTNKCSMLHLYCQENFSSEIFLLAFRKGLS